MDYKYIEQLLERYWQCETTLEEEAILRTFFSQKDVPPMLLPYRDLFQYEQNEISKEVLGADFDERLRKQIGDVKVVKARTRSLAARLKPLMKAAAVVAVFITIGNAIQSAFDVGEASHEGIAAEINRVTEGATMAQSDTIILDTLRQNLRK